DRSAGAKHTKSVELLARIVEDDSGFLSVQVLSEFYSAVTKKSIIRSQEAEDVIGDLADWALYRPQHADVLNAIKLQRRFKIQWWDALILNSAIKSGCSILWTEDLNHSQKY